MSLVHLDIFCPLNSSRGQNILNYKEIKVNPQINPFQLPLEVKFDKRQPLVGPVGNKLFLY